MGRSKRKLAEIWRDERSIPGTGHEEEEVMF